MAGDSMGKYDSYVDNESAYEVLQEQDKAAEERTRLEAERAWLEKEKAEVKKQKEWEAEQKKKERAADRRRAQIERTLINTGAQVLKRGLLNTLFKK